MNKGKLLRGIGVAIAVIGMLIAVYAVLPEDTTYDATIPSGDYFYYIQIGAVLSGSMDVDFVVADGSIVSFVFDSEQFDAYTMTGSADYLVRVSGNSGSFTFDLPDLGTYYVVFQHSDVSWMLDQDLHITVNVSGVGLVGMSVGVVMIVVGALMAFFGSRIMKKEAMSNPPAPPAQTDVMIFQGNQQNPPGKT